MTISLTGPFLLGVVGLMVAFIVHAVVIARWTARIQAIVEKHDAEIISLRVAKHEQSTKSFLMDSRIAVNERELAHVVDDVRRLEREAGA